MAEQPEEKSTLPAREGPPRWSVGRIVGVLVAFALFGYALSQAILTWQGRGDPVALQLGPLQVPWYGVMLMSGALAGALVGELQARWFHWNVEHVWNILLWGLISAVTVSRLWYVLGNVKYYFGSPLRIIGIEGGRFVGLRGLTIHGALLGAVIAVIFYTWRNKLYFWDWLDLGAPGFVMGQAVGRWGNFFNQEAYGWRTTLPWGLRIAPNFRIDALGATGQILPEYTKLAEGSLVCNAPNLACYTDMSRFPFDATRFHPTFLYESLWNLSTCAFLLFLSRRYRDRFVPGEIFFLYGLLYSIGRFAIEFLRVDSIYTGPLFGQASSARFPVGQVVSVGFFLFCVGIIIIRRWLWKRGLLSRSKAASADQQE